MTDVYRTGPPAPPRSWLWDSPDRLTMLAFALGTASATASLGVLAVWKDDSLQIAMVVLALGIFGGAVWAGLINAALAVPGWAAILLLSAVWAVGAFFKLALLALGMTDLRPSLEPRAGQYIAVLSDAALLVSFAAVLRLARRVRRGDTPETPVDLAISASAWLAAVAATGVVIAPSLGLRSICAAVLLAALLALVRAGTRARASDGAPGSARRRTAGGVLRGATIAVLGGVAVVVARLPEVNVSPVVEKIYKERGSCVPCRIHAAGGGRPGLSVWCIECAGVAAPGCYPGAPGFAPLARERSSACGPSSPGFPMGWDERAGKVIDGEELEQRLRAP